MEFKAQLLKRPGAICASSEKAVRGDIEAIVLREEGNDDQSSSDRKDLQRLKELLSRQKQVLDRLLRE